MAVAAKASFPWFFAGIFDLYYETLLRKAL